MIKEIRLNHWKSFSHAKLFIDQLTVLIGTNASGKSNVLDALDFLNKISSGKDIQSSLEAIRGGVAFAALRSNHKNNGRHVTLEVLIQGSGNISYSYSVTVKTFPRVELQQEMLVRIKERQNTKSNPGKIKLFYTDNPDDESPSIIARLYNERAGTKKECRRTHSILSQLQGLNLRHEITEGVELVSKTLQGIFILDPIPSRMRSYSPFSNVLANDASNIAGVLAALPEDEKNKVESKITEYVRQLPERDIRKVWAKAVGEFQTDAMLYCEEEWVENQSPMLVDARGMSDGTLRFLGILTALLTRPSGTQIVIEEVDNGLHPSRAHLLLQILKTISFERNIDVLITTHNPALLDALGPSMIPFVTVAHRDIESGESKLTLLEDINMLSKILASGPLGKVTTEGKIEKSLAHEGKRPE